MESGTKMSKIDYDLNIFRKEEQVGLDADSFPKYDYVDPWYLHVYQVNSYQGASMHEEMGPAIELTELESNALQLGSGYFDEDDCWYGLDGFLKEYGHLLTERLLNLLDLPLYTEEVLF